MTSIKIKSMLSKKLNVAKKNIRVKKDGSWLFVYLRRGLESYIEKKLGKMWHLEIEQLIINTGYEPSTYYSDGGSLNPRDDEKNCIIIEIKDFSLLR